MAYSRRRKAKGKWRVAGLKRYGKLIINPIIGPKKSGDINFTYLDKIYKYIIKKMFNSTYDRLL